MKKNFMMLSCITAVAIAAFVGKKTFESHTYETNNLLMQNVEALSQVEGEPYPEDRKKCIEEGGDFGIWHLFVRTLVSKHVHAKSLEKFQY